MRHRLHALIGMGCALLLAPANAVAEGALPAFFSLPGDTRPCVEVIEERFGEADFGYPDHRENVRRGHHWQTILEISGMPDDSSGKALWAHLKPSLVAAGWSVAQEYNENPFSVVLQTRKQPARWAILTLFERADIRIDLVEEGAPGIRLALPIPAAIPEKVDPERGDFPWLPPLPGSRFESGQLEAIPFEVPVPNSDAVELVGSGSVIKGYVLVKC